MARRRLNYQLVVYLLCGTAVAGGGALAILKGRAPHNPAPFIAAGDASIKNHEYLKAVNDYEVASSLLPHDASVHVKLGHAYFEARNQSADYFENSVAQFTKAEELDPTSKEAWAGLLEANEVRVENWEARPGDVREAAALPASIQMARIAADHLHALEPDNIQAEAMGPILIIRSWLLNLTMPEETKKNTTQPVDQAATEKTPEQRAEQAAVELTALQHKAPDNDKIPYWIAREKIYAAQQAAKSEHPDNATPLLVEAAAQFDDSINAKPDVVGLYINKASILGMVQAADPNASNWQDYRHKIHDTLEIAQAKADPTNVSQYELVKQQWARVESQTDPIQAAVVYHDLISRFPNELVFRADLAQMYQHLPAHRKDALALLEEVDQMPGPPVTNVALRAGWDRTAAYCKLLRADIQTDQLAQFPNGKAHTDLVSSIQSEIDLARPQLDNTSQLLRVLGRFQLYNGQTRDAINTLTQAADKMTVESGSVNYELIKDEAEAYRRGGQSGKAIELLERFVNDPISGANTELQFKLATLNLENQDFEKAKPYVSWLATRFPDDPQVISLQIREFGPNADWSKVKPLYDRLPEKEPADVQQKYNVAASLSNKPEALRLLTGLHKSDLPNGQVTASLVQLLVGMNRIDEAKQAVAESQAASPNDKALAVLKGALDKQEQTSLEQDELGVLNAIQDPLQRAMKKSQYYAVKENPEEEMRCLQEALKLDPDNKALNVTIFVRHMDSKRFSDAEAMLPHLSEIDADNAHGLMLKTKLALAKQDIPNALLFSRQMKDDEPNFANSFEMYGEALQAHGDLELACEQFNTAISLQATNIDSWKNLIRCTVQQNKLDEAKSYITKACQRFPNDPQYRDMRVQYEILYGNPESILPELITLVNDHPEEPRNYGMLADAEIACMRSKSDLGQTDAANAYMAAIKDTFNKAVTRWPDDIRFTNSLSQVLVQTKDFDAAVNCIKTLAARAQWKDQPTPLVMLGRVYLSAGKSDEAEKVLRQALALDPRSVQTHLVLSDCLVIEQKYEDALSVLQPATNDFRVREKYTDLLISMGRGTQAEVNVQAAIEAQPTNVALRNLLLHIYDAEGSFDQGIRAASEDLKVDSRNMSAYYWRGKMEAEGVAPDLDFASKDLNVFLSANPKSVTGLVALAKVLELSHNRDDAIKELESALQFDSQNREVRMLLLREYSASTPPRTMDEEHLLTQTLAIPQLEHDWQFETSAALLWANKGEGDKAVAAIQDAMLHAPDKSQLLPDYFSILLTTKDDKNLTLLLKETDSYVSDPKSSWYIFADRGSAKAGLGDIDGATAEFNTALDRAGAIQGRDAGEAVASIISKAKGFGVEKALALTLPRAQNSVTWKLICIDLYITQGENAKGIALAQEALKSADSLTPADRQLLYHQTSSLYLNANPPMAEEAAVIYKKVLVDHPDDVESLNDMACILSDMVTPTRPAEALNYSQHAFDLIQKAGHMNARIYDTQGWVLVLNNHLEEGIDVMHQAVDQADFPDAHYHLAEAYLRKQLPEDAQRELELATQMIKKRRDSNLPLDQGLQQHMDGLAKQIDEQIRAKSSDKSPA